MLGGLASIPQLEHWNGDGFGCGARKIDIIQRDGINSFNKIRDIIDELGI